MQILAAALEGLQKAETKVDETAGRLARLGAGSVSASGNAGAANAAPVDAVDLTTEMVNLLTAKSEYEMNLKSLETGEQMMKHTLDILG